MNPRGSSGTESTTSGFLIQLSVLNSRIYNHVSPAIKYRFKMRVLLMHSKEDTLIIQHFINHWLVFLLFYPLMLEFCPNPRYLLDFFQLLILAFARQN